ncbi:MAG: hypothetical protein WDO68_22210 [Gammaproteobacteria bacterium]
MNLPSLKTLRQWLPMTGGLCFALWILLLVMLSLFSTREPAGAVLAVSSAKGRAGCVSMPDGIKVCDDVAEGGK